MRPGACRLGVDAAKKRASPYRAFRPLAAAFGATDHLEGATPSCTLNQREKALTELNPSRSPISDTLMDLALR